MLEDTNKKNTEQIEKEIVSLIVKYSLQSKLSLNKVKQWVYEISDNDPMKAFETYLRKLKAYFSKVKTKEEFEKITSVFIDAWNHFPHKDLGDLSPQQKIELQTKGTFFDETQEMEYNEILIPFEMTAILTFKAKMVGMTLREYILYVIANHIEESLNSTIFSLNNLTKEKLTRVNSLPAPKISDQKKNGKNIYKRGRSRKNLSI